MFFILIALFSCNKPNSSDSPTSPSSTDTASSPGGSTANQVKKNMLVSIGTTNPGLLGIGLTYDSSRRLKAINNEYHVYWKNDTIDHIVTSGSLNGQTTVTSTILMYNVQKQCYKTVTKTRSSWTPGDPAVAETNAYFSDASDGEYIGYDSLIYSPSGQLTELWETGNGTSAVSKTFTFLYTNAQSEAPYKIQYWGLSPTGQPGTLRLDLALTTNNTDQPIYNAFWFEPFLKNSPFMACVTPQMVGAFHKIMPLIKKCTTQWKLTYYIDNTYDFGYNSIYYYNSDSTIFTGRQEPDDITFYRFTYQFKKL